MSDKLYVPTTTSLREGLLVERFQERPLSNLSRLEILLDRSDLEAIIAISPENVPYLAGVFIDTQRSIRDRLAAVVWPRAGAPSLIVCNIEEPQAIAESWIEDVRAYVEFEQSPIELLAQVLEDKNLDDKRIGIELGYLSARFFAGLSDLLPEATFVSCEDLFSQARVVKTPSEIELLGYAARATEKALMTTFASTRPGDTEKSMANRLAGSLLADGAGEINFLYINAGPNTGFPHCKATDYRAQTGDVVKSDVGGYFDGYLSDVARTAFLGQPSDEQRSIYERLIQVHHETIAAAAPGNTAAQVFFTAKEAYASVNLNFPLPHAGHSVGISTHEWPMLSPAHEVELLPDTMLYIESRVRWPGKVGYHVEDLIHVTKDGPRVLTTTFPSDELFII